MLDLCCGEGGTAVWLARTLGVRVAGVDIIGQAVTLARSRAADEGVGHLAGFVQGNIFSLPLAGGMFDVVMGQDPDGFAHGGRLAAFQESFRVLRPGGAFGILHWVPGVGAPAGVKDAFDRVNVAAGYPSHRDVNADAYLEAMKEAGFTGIRVVDKSATYHAHLAAIRHLCRGRGEEPDQWTAACLELSAHHPFGVALFGRKP